MEHSAAFETKQVATIKKNDFAKVTYRESSSAGSRDSYLRLGEECINLEETFLGLVKISLMTSNTKSLFDLEEHASNTKQNETASLT